MKRRLLAAFAAALFFLQPSLCLAANVVGKDGNGAVKNWKANGDGSSGTPYIQHTIPTDGTNTAVFETAGADAGSNTASRLAVTSWLQGFNGTTWDRVRVGFTSPTASVTGYLNVLPFARYNATPPTLTDGQSVALQVNSSGALKVDPSGATQPISGSVAATQSGTWNVGLSAGSNTIGKVDQGAGGASAWKVDGSAVTQPVSGTVSANAGSGTFAANLSQVSGNTINTGTGNTGTGTQRVVLASDQPAIPVTGTFWQATQPVSLASAVTVQQSTAANLKVDLSGTAANTTAIKVDGSSFTQPVSGTFWQATQPVSGTVTANLSASTNAGATAKTSDYDTGAGTDTVIGFGVLLPKSGGAVAGGTSSDPIRIDPTGTTAQPVTDNGGSLTVDGSVSIGSALPAGTNYIGKTRLTDGTNDVTLKSLTNAKAVPTAIVDGNGDQITSFGGGTQYADGNTQSTPTGTVALGKNGSNVLHALSLDGSGYLNVNVAAGGASGGTSSNFGSAFPTPGTAAGFSDGTNMQGSRVFDADSGAGTQYVLGAVLRKSASGGSVELGTSSDPVRVDPTGTTTQPVSGTVTVQQSTASNLKVDLSGTAANATAIKVDGSAVTQPISAASLPLPTGAATAAKQPALGTAGSASSDVITVQGIASMTALKVDGSAVTQPVSGTFWQATQPVSGTITANAGTGNFSTNLAQVGGSSLALGQTTMSASLPVALASNQSDLPGKTAQATATTGTFTNATQTTSVSNTSVSGYPTVTVSINGTYGTATGVFEASDDAGTTWYGVDATRTDSNTIETGYTSLTNTSRMWVVPINGANQFRVRSTAVASGTANIRITPTGAITADATVVSIGSALPTGSNVIGALSANQSVNVAQLAGTTTDTNSGNKSAGTLRVVLATDQPQLTNKLLVTPDANSTINVAQVNGGTTSTVATGVQKVGIADSGGTAFLSAANALNSTGGGIQAAQVVGQFDDTSPTSITENQFGNLRMSANRNAYTTIRDAAGNERGVNVNASNQLSVSVDNTPAVSQSGTWTVQPGNTANTTPWLVSEQAATSGGVSLTKVISAATTNATSVKASAGQVYMITASNINASPRYLKLYNKASSPTVGTDTPVLVFLIPGNTSGAGTNIPVPSCGLTFGTGIALAITTGVADNDTGAVAANDIVVNIGYK